jgi:hypothetical protein
LGGASCFGVTQTIKKLIKNEKNKKYLNILLI